MTPPTDADLARWEALCAAATPGPWKVCPDETTEGALDLVCCGQGDEHAGPICHSPLTPGDTQFIAAARDAMPALLAEVRRLRLMVPRSRTVPALRVRYPWTAEELRAADSVAAHARSLA